MCEVKNVISLDPFYLLHGPKIPHFVQCRYINTEVEIGKPVYTQEISKEIPAWSVTCQVIIIIIIF